jgi:hypothetical protein
MFPPGRPFSWALNTPTGWVEGTSDAHSNDIELPATPNASRADPHRAGSDWTVTFSDQELFAEEDFAITSESLADAGVDLSLEGLVRGYVETRMLVAGYGISTWDEKPPATLGAGPFGGDPPFGLRIRVRRSGVGRYTP